jgi:MYXO-CTERM domain-containing protein
MRSRLVGLAALLPAMLSLMAAVPMTATASTTSYSLTVSESASTMSYGSGVTPTFRATLTLPSDDPVLAGNTTPFYISVAAQNYIGSLSGLFPTYSLFVGGINAPPPGAYPVVAHYESPNHGLLSSAPVTLTVTKIMPAMNCYIVNVASTYAPSTRLTITVAFGDTNLPVDIEDATFTIIFAGPQTFSVTHLKASTGDRVFAPVPSVPGVYQAKCQFNGTALFRGTTAQLSPDLVVSARHNIAGIGLYTSPAPVTHGPSILWEVVIYPGPGLPIPTGRIGLQIGPYFTHLLDLASGGKITFRAVAPSVTSTSKIQVFYYGDPTYASSSASFSLKTSPIGGAVTPSPKGKATPATTSSPSPSVQPSPSSAPSIDPVPASSKLATPPPGTGSVFEWFGIGFLTLVGIGGLAWRRRRHN